MLQELRVENLLLIEEAQLRLAPGLNVLTGETGAGKTVLAHALDLLLAGRARPGIVRPGSAEAYVEGVFEASEVLRSELGERLSADAGEIVLARRVGSDGRTRAYLNGRAVTIGELREVSGRLLAFYGQHEHRKLTLAASQLEVLDGHCGAPQVKRLADCAAALGRQRAARRRLDELQELAAARERELDLLSYELAEIDSVAASRSEYEQLIAARERLRRLEELLHAASGGAEALAPESDERQGAGEMLAPAIARLDALAGTDARLDALTERLRAVLIESQDLAAELREYCARAGILELEGALGEIAGDEVSLELLEERLEAIERLARKHGGSIEAVHEHAERARERRAELEGVELAIAEGEEQLREAQAELERHVLALRRARSTAAAQLARAVREQLGALAMGDASFEVALSEREPSASGADAAEFLIAPNPGVPAAPLREIASGGELSRIMLAIMGVESAGAASATLVFDEVDAGIGGHTARAVGARLQELALRRQVLCITHLAQIASLGDRHFAIVKDTTAEPTRTSVVTLGEQDVEAELVRMLGADADDTSARRHARDLRRAA
jgi:DNA repair protein RecN (Recombination protein N)